MKQQYALGILFTLLFATFCTSFFSYRTTAERVNRDMSQALALALADQQSDIINEDTVRSFNSHLQLKELRGKATLAVDTRQQQFTCYAHCSSATIFALSDQRPASLLWAVALLWTLFCLYQHFKTKTPSVKPCAEFGGLTYSEADGQFYSASGTPLRLTPMQQQLLEMFFRSPSHRLTKTAICDTLWPKKPDANDTLYTLIRRLRPIIEAHSTLKISSDRGRSYQLTDSRLA